jgi:hypothetical protein
MKTYDTWEDYYIHEVKPFFGFLVREYGFVLEMPPANNDIRSVTFGFRKNDCEIQLWIDQGVPPYVIIADNDSRKAKRLDQLIRKYCPSRKVKRPRGFCGPEIDRSTFIEAYGRVLKEEFSALLENESPEQLSELLK